MATPEVSGDKRYASDAKKRAGGRLTARQRLFALTFASEAAPTQRAPPL
jgi:hypothetical protein